MNSCMVDVVRFQTATRVAVILHVQNQVLAHHFQAKQPNVILLAHHVVFPQKSFRWRLFRSRHVPSHFVVAASRHR